MGGFFLVQQVATGSDLYSAFLKGVSAAAVLMILGGVAERLSAGDKLKRAELPGGIAAEFETTEAANKTREGVEQLNSRVTKLSEQMITMQAQLDRRVSDLEAGTFKDQPPEARRTGNE